MVLLLAQGGGFGLESFAFLSWAHERDTGVEVKWFRAKAQEAGSAVGT